MRRLIVLRPEPGASATVARARELGPDATALPLFEIEPVAWEAPDPDGFDGLLLTSANAIRFAGAQLSSLRRLAAYAVGEGTAKAADEAGFAVAITGNAGIDALLSGMDRKLRLLHLCGEDRREPVNASQQITSIPVYRAKAVDAPKLDGIEGSVALIHSPRAGRRFAELMQRGRRSIAIAAISQAAADAAGTGWGHVEAAHVPTDDALLALAARLCNKPLPE